MEIFALLPATRDGGTVKAEFRSLPSSPDLSKNPILFGFPLPKLCEQPGSRWSSGTTTQTTAKRVHNRPHWPASGSWTSPASPDFPCRQKGDNGSPRLVSVPRLDRARVLVGPPIDFSHSLTNRRWTWNGKLISSNLTYLVCRESSFDFAFSSAPCGA